MLKDPHGSCPFCLHPRSVLAFTVSGWCHFQCERCASIHIDPPPTIHDLEELYDGEPATPQSMGCWQSDPLHMHSLWSWVLNKVEHEIGKGPLLDVGCGNGRFLSFARQRGWSHLEGIEIASRAANLARESSDASVHRENFLAKDFGEQRFHSITFWSVFEHFPAPDQVLKKCRCLLAPEGVVVLDVPHSRGLSLRLFRKHTVVIRPPEHITYPSIPGIRSLLEREGFTVRAICTSMIYLEQITRAMGQQARTKEPNNAPAYRRGYSLLTSNVFFLRSMDMANLILNACRLGDQLTVVATRS